MIRERIKINVSGENQTNIKNQILNKLCDYFSLNAEEIIEQVEIELDVSTDENNGYSAVAYVKLKNNNAKF